MSEPPSQPPGSDELRIFVEPRGDDKGFDVVFHVNGKEWKRLGPYNDLDYANMICREALKRAASLAERYWKEMGGKP